MHGGGMMYEGGRCGIACKRQNCNNKIEKKKTDMYCFRT